MKVAGTVLMCLAGLILLVAFSMSGGLAGSTTINLDMIAQREMIAQLGVGLLVSGAVLFAGGAIVEALAETSAPLVTATAAPEPAPAAPPTARRFRVHDVMLGDWPDLYKLEPGFLVDLHADGSRIKVRYGLRALGRLGEIESKSVLAAGLDRFEGRLDKIEVDGDRALIWVMVGLKRA